MAFRLTCVGFAAGLAIAAAAHAQAAPPAPSVETDAAGMQARIAIPATAGRVTGRQIAAALDQAELIRLGAARPILAATALNLNSRTAPVQVAALSAALGAEASCRIERPKGADGEPVLEITIDRLAADQARKQREAQLRRATTALRARLGASEAARFGIRWDVDAALNDPSASGPLVVLIHGYNSSPEQCANLLQPTREVGLDCGVLRYPNDQAIAASATLLAGELAALAEAQPNRRVTLVTFSMGGLVAREAVENPALDPANVDRLIMIAPPNRGTRCAELSRGLDLWEHGIRQRRSHPLDIVRGAVEDGLGEARRDLLPNSVFLRQLNARGRNPAVRYAIVLGDGGKLTDAQRALVGRAVAPRGTYGRWHAALQQRACEAVDWLNRQCEDGDGVVSLECGRLDGVDDLLVLPLNHWNIAGPAGRPLDAALRRHIERRLPPAD